MTMPEFVYSLCAATSVACAVMLLRAFHVQRTSLLFWSGVCFVGLALNNLLLLIDLYVVPSVDLFRLRTGIAVAAMFALLFGLVWERR
jgi:hypothetical protein